MKRSDVKFLINKTMVEHAGCGNNKTLRKLIGDQIAKKIKDSLPEVSYCRVGVNSIAEKEVEILIYYNLNGEGMKIRTMAFSAEIGGTTF